MTTILPKEVEKAVLRIMNYTDGNNVCKNCVNFVGTDCSGSLGALNSHCTFNPAFILYVNEAGTCKYFEKRTK